MSRDQIKSRQRVADYAEVFTSEREVNAMLDLVKQETERIDSRFLEPACGTGNFLAEILRRKLEVVTLRYKRSQIEWERYAILAVSSIYGIDILEDNVEECRNRLLTIFAEEYDKLFRKTSDDCKDAAKFILGKNILLGDALTMKIPNTRDEQGAEKPIVFAEWSAINGNLLKRRDFIFSSLLESETSQNKPVQASLIADKKNNNRKRFRSDHNMDVFIPIPVAEFPLVHFLKVRDYE